jgi:hypothetical protein
MLDEKHVSFFLKEPGQLIAILARSADHQFSRLTRALERKCRS